MVVLLRISTIILVLCIMPKISPYRISTQNLEQYMQDETEPNATDEQNIHQIHSILSDNEDDNKMDLSALKKTIYRLEKRNGDLINFLLGLPKGMLDAGKK